MKVRLIKLIQSYNSYMKTKTKAEQYEKLRQYLCSCIKITPVYEDIKTKEGKIISWYKYGDKIDCSIDIDELYSLIGIKTNFNQGGNNVKL